MQFRFSIIDRNKDFDIIEEPVGWDNISFKLSRDKDLHGLFYDYATNSFEFYGLGRDLLKSEYETYGVEGMRWLRVEYDCTDRGQWMHFYTSRFLFAQYQEICGDACFIKIGIENISEIIELRNRMDQKVDLTATKCFDTVTDLAAYAKLPFTVEIPAKLLQVISDAKNETSLISEDFVDNSEWKPNTVFGDGFTGMRAQFVPGFTNIVTTGIPDTQFFGEVTMKNGGFSNRPADGLTPLIYLQELSGALQCVTNQAHVAFRYKGQVQIEGSSPLIAGRFQIVRLPVGLDPEDPADYEYIYDEQLDFAGFDLAADLDFTFNIGDQLWCYTFIHPSDEQNIDKFIIIEEPVCFFKVTVDSICDPSDATAYMINEAMSRVIESITNNKLKLYSEYLGRTDSQPFAFESNGCGSLEFITNGLKIRQVKNTDGSEPSMFISLKDGFNSLSAIHNLGMGVEKFLSETNIKEDITDDLLNSQSRDFRVRIEDWKWFYKPEVVMTCDDVNMITTTVKQEKHIATFRIGYEKWEAENYTGLDEFLTKREFRTQLTQVNNVLEKISKMITSGYATEITRREGNTSKDWRYDQDIFLICVDENYVVEQGNIINPANIIDPDTIINYRLSPIRNLMRWFSTIIASYPNITSANKLLFASGDGNLIAIGQLSEGFCRMENQAVQENQAMDITFFADVTEALPIMKPEEVVFEYPCSIEEFKMLLASPYNRIRYNNDCCSGSGWIQEVDFKPNDGKARFTLIPAIDDVVDNIVAGNDFIVTEDGIIITTEDGSPIIIEP